VNRPLKGQINLASLHQSMSFKTTKLGKINVMNRLKNILPFLVPIFVSIPPNVFGIELVYDVYKVNKPAPTVIIGHACGGKDGARPDQKGYLHPS
jgi:hypothetical protein